MADQWADDVRLSDIEDRFNGGVKERLAGQMTRAQALRLKCLADEAYQPSRYASGLSFEEAERRIDALKAEIELANSY
jgi:Protein of unknown function (DUF3072)